MTTEEGDTSDREDSSDEDSSSDGEERGEREEETEEDKNPNNVDAIENRQCAQVDKEIMNNYPKLFSHPLLHNALRKFLFGLNSREAKLEEIAKLVAKYDWNHWITVETWALEWAYIEKWTVIRSEGFLKELISRKIKETEGNLDDIDDDDEGEGGDSEKENGEKEGDDNRNDGGYDQDDDNDNVPLSKSVFAKIGIEAKEKGAMREEIDEDELLERMSTMSEKCLWLPEKQRRLRQPQLRTH